MKIQIQTARALPSKADLLAIGIFEGEQSLPFTLKKLDRALNGNIRKILKKNFSGKERESLIVSPTGKLPYQFLLLVGLGKSEKYNLNRLRGFVGAVIRAAKHYKAKELTLALDGLLGPKISLEAGEVIEAAAEAALLADFSFDKYKSKQEEDSKGKNSIAQLTLAVTHKITGVEKKLTQWASVLAGSANFARILTNEPSNVMTPAAMAKAASVAVRGTGVRCTLRDERWLSRQGMNAILAVAQGSANRPRLVVLEYNPRGVKTAPIALVGKGVTFDSGGISIKPSEGMEKMKYDMSGGAVVIATLQALAKLGIREKVIGIVPLVENMPSGSAQRPGDVVKTYSGKYVEVLNTDAEGRLILSDALAYAQKFKPKAIIDLATLTGACVVALGHEAIGMMGTDDQLKARLKQAGEKTGERVWELPLWDEYAEYIKSEVADIKNIGMKGAAGTITAAMFLKEFVGGYPWVHLDIAGTAWMEKSSHPYLGQGPTGVGVRLLVETIRNW